MRTNLTIDLTTEQLELLGRSLGKRRATREDVRASTLAALHQLLDDLARIEQRARNDRAAIGFRCVDDGGEIETHYAHGPREAAERYAEAALLNGTPHKNPIAVWRATVPDSDGRDHPNTRWFALEPPALGNTAGDKPMTTKRYDLENNEPDLGTLEKLRDEARAHGDDELATNVNRALVGDLAGMEACIEALNDALARQD